MLLLTYQTPGGSSNVLNGAGGPQEVALVPAPIGDPSIPARTTSMDAGQEGALVLAPIGDPSIPAQTTSMTVAGQPLEGNAWIPAEGAVVPASKSAFPNQAQTTSWDAALQQIVTHEAGLDRQQCPFNQIRYQEDRLVVGDHILQLDDNGFDHLARRLKAPPDYLAQLTSELRSGLINYHLEHYGPSDRLTDNHNLVLSRDGFFRGFDRGDLCRLPGTDVLQAVRDGLRDNTAELEIQALNLTDTALKIDIVGP